MSGATKVIKEKKISSATKKESMTAYLCLIPAFLGLSVISYVPTIAVFVLSLFSWNGITTPEFVGLENFQRIFTKDIYFASSIKATIIYALLAVVGSILYSLVIAIFLNMKIAGRTFWRSVFFIPYLLPAMGVFTGWRWLYEINYGLFNFINRLMGLPAQQYLDSPTQVLPSLALIAIWCSGNLIVIFLAGLQNVPRVYMEAAEIDGANAWQRFWNITVPSISPIIFYNVLIALITNLQVITPALALTDGGPQNASMFMSYVIYMYAFRKNKVGYAAAYAAVFFILVGIFTVALFATQKEQFFGEGDE
ncbi:MAG: sugar ABC transporter permease [Lachnospiraceae bacterium]|nr:sugar ABC transporter permease [Lachnospiraceae bacterium]